ncbi:MAG TPA: VCBS repeat-containing protein [Ideonella sp.]|nr:VCBS repeat-containing protein [Ideonella sp.]
MRVLSLPAGDEPHTLSAADYNGDGWPDLVGIGSVSASAGFEFQQPGALRPRIAKALGTGKILP